MLKKLSSVLILALALGGQHFVVSSAFAQDSSAPAADTAAPAADAAAPAPEAAAPAAEADASSAPASAIDSANESTAGAETPYGMGKLWKEGDAVTKTVLVLMILMSASTWYIAAIKLMVQSKLFSQANDARKVWDAKSLQDGVNNLKADSAFRVVAEDGLRAAKQHDANKIDLESWLSQSIQRSVNNITNDLQTGMAVLATVASTSPFVGLFGTVWGIYHALIAIAQSGQPSIDKVAGPVGEALIMTAIGLGVAVPAVFLYNWLVRRNKVASESLNAFGADVHGYLILGINGGDK
ncbi:MAG: MotA/TolQ/ExbB proton channel family protein [Moraxellaceae bacterium]|nr:MAG: MotA/TolQ/ExbB proton channel family protein [Moraxellaceae bacterium]